MVSPTLAIHETVASRLAAGVEVLHLGFGEAGLPVHPLLKNELASAAACGGYDPVAGDAAVRAAVARYYTRRGVETEAEQILVGPGSKAVLFALMLALEGDVVLPKPSWVSYAAQSALVGKQVIRVAIPAGGGGVPDADALTETVADARKCGLKPRVLLITNPDNPTGSVTPTATLSKTLEAARENDLFVISDEIYSDLVHENDGCLTAACLDADCAVTGGLSKSLALGGWRFGTLRLPATGRGDQLLRCIQGIASEIWSCVAVPVARAARLAYDEPPELTDFVVTARMLHRQVVTAIRETVEAGGGRCGSAAAAFYLYPDFEAARDALHVRGIRSGSDLARTLLDDFDIAVLPGAAFGDDDAGLRVRIATSLLYGPTDADRWAALAAAREGRAACLPRIVTASRRLGDALSEVAA